MHRIGDEGLELFPGEAILTTGGRRSELAGAHPPLEGFRVDSEESGRVSGIEKPCLGAGGIHREQIALNGSGSQAPFARTLDKVLPPAPICSV